MQLQATATIEHDSPAPHHGVRPYRALDEQPVLDVLKASLRRWGSCPDPVALWRWKHFANPFGNSCVLVHEAADGSIAGVVALMFWRLRQGRNFLLAERSTDLATHPAHRRQGVASSFYAPAHHYLKEAGVRLVFHTPNRNSIGFTRNSKRPIFALHPQFGICNPRIALACTQIGKAVEVDNPQEPLDVFKRKPLPVSALFSDRERLAHLIAQDGLRRGHRLQTARSVEYLNWRYAMHPTIRYYAAAVETNGAFDACLIYRIDRIGGARRVVAQELLLRQPSDRVVSMIREQLYGDVDCDVVQYYDCGEGPWRDVLPRPSLPTWNGYSMTVGTYDPALGRVPLDPGSWSLSLGDLQEI